MSLVEWPPLQSCALKNVHQIPKIQNPLSENKLNLYRQGLGRSKSCHDDQNRDTIASLNSNLYFVTPPNRVTIM